MIQMLRHLGWACRYVSGYAFNPESFDGHELHAWLDVYIPGGGWIGIDPSLGLFTTDHYVPVATGPHPSLTMPVTGSYRGAAQSYLTHEVTVEEI